MNSFDIALATLVDAALKEDIGNGDHSTLSCIPATKQGKAILKIKEDGILAGVEVANKIFHFIEPSCEFIPFKKDGDKMQVGDIAFEITASVHAILKGERLVLNCMQRMSGIATLTNRYTQLLKGYHTRLLDTRKTTPNFRLLEKEAVRIGGGINHRFGLYDMIMLKDNHIDYCGGIIEAINQAYTYSNHLEQPLKIEVETRNLADVLLVCNQALNKVDRIMLDNFSPNEVSEALAIIQGRVETEASGGINLTTIELFAKTGVDFVSVGGLIHQAQSLDLSLKASFVK
ncbi:carboxylating nicotinate-nucleotide diphosphorylase [Sediminibacterium sp.]|uniref:carboxylating nicotinate-nucleotide diphosphorylase n=1 Tax=Sediminibacterium sp. TaxID=1917865 RepID=UPI002737305B|nr:carboxylating nicotinate-nucleotide diphosphorylase [Sediminibacterium sp.]MDP3393275.1 carboxylating nicotinate-nucleotide diphosphorylase [Sediminibacterium sp.]MDP3567877.1 carboxylating nicotinate-nucleotide diphosphorylase [Sediminibacterium sp.]